MSVHFVSGKPGAGKSLYGVRLVIDELVHGDRCIVTNLPLRLDRLNEYLQQEYPERFAKMFTGPDGQILHITDRVVLFNEDDLSRFFTIRSNGVRIESISNEDWKKGVRPDYSVVKDWGILYVLDEVHIGFNARAWAATGSEVIYYLSQHRKVGDDVVAITQHIANVDKQFRSVAQDFTYIKNLSKQRAGFFRLPGIFTRNTYAQPATDTSKPQETGTFTLDMSGLASCYDTAKGVGIHGRAGADTAARKKGFHWAWGVAIIIGLVLFWYQFAPNMLASLFDHKPKKPVHPLPVRVSPVVPPVTPVTVIPSRVYSPAPAVEPQTTRYTEKQASEYVPPYVPLGFKSNADPLVQCTGYVFIDGKPTVFFSDGSKAEGDEVQTITRHEVVCFGRTFAISAPRAAMGLPVASAPVVLNAQTAIVDLPETYHPVNDAIVLPTIHGRSYGNPPAPKLNGLQRMQGQQSSSGSQTQAQNTVYNQ
ncbi:MAG TPA: zonular occludens toxin domain-containing protein [Verrucomicrobiae bacterium]|nr:zonular occludens toxin domain-containing protein [Verrucomicrobiae bacterium]